MKRLVIDASRANSDCRTGVEWYALHMIVALVKVVPQETEVLLLSKKPLVSELQNLPSNWKHKQLSWPFPRLWTQIRLSWEMRKHSDATLFIPASGPPLVHPDLIITIHDVGFAAMPELYSWRDRWMQMWTTRRAAHRARLICTPSEFSKQHIIKYFDVGEHDVAVIPNAPVHDGMIENRNPQRTIVYVGRIEHKKNISTLIRAFEILKRSEHRLILQLVGISGFGYQDICKRINQSQYKDDIKLLGYVSESEKKRLLQHAGVFVFPSWYEGFGIPVLEAAHQGVPVIASNIPPHREIAGDAITYADPADPREWAEKIQTVLQKNPPSETQTSSGLRITDQYSWEKSARAWWEVVSRLQSVN